MCPSPFSHLHLLIGGDSTEDNLREALGREHTEADAPNHSSILDQCQGLVLPAGSRAEGEGSPPHRPPGTPQPRTGQRRGE